MITKDAVLNLLNEGHNLTKTRFIGYSTVTINNQFVNKNSFNSLVKKGIIIFSHKDGYSNSIYIKS